MTSATRVVSLASKPNPRNVAPATSAARARSESVACANANVASVTCVISFAVKPNFANSVCNSATCEALKMVDAPKRLASSSRAWNSSAVAPETALTFDICSSNAWNVLTAIAPIPAIGAVNCIVSFLPVACIWRPALSRARSALFNPVTSGAMFAKNRRFMDERFIECRTFD